MGSLERQFTADDLKRALGFLNERLMAIGITGEICLVGGAVMILAFGSRHSTRDIDALAFAPVEIRKAAEEIAQEQGYPLNWLNDGAKGFATGEPLELKPLLQYSHLRILTPPAEYILAMKCLAARVGLDEHDKEDAQFLAKHLGVRDADSIFKIVEKYYPKARIPAKTEYFIQEVLNESV